ncbi:DNA polymerase type-B-like family protein [Abortiporus biennis]
MTAVYSQPLSLQNIRQQPPHLQSPVQSSPTPRKPTKHRFYLEFSQCLIDFVVQLLPTPEELAVKEDVRKLLERLIRTIEPDSRLLSFGSTANGFSLRNSDMDLCCLIDSEERLAAADLVTMLGDLLERETKFHVKPLPHARIPIVKLSLDPSPGLPFGIACDIGFENRLALENTRLLMCYAMIDPPRVRTMVLFLKVWCKRRKINSPYKGTLSSYGYVLLVIFFLVHVKNPPVLPNLQQMPPLRPISQEESTLNGHNIWFFDDINLLRQRWQSSNTETVAELLVDFFKYYSRDFLYNSGVASIRAGLLKKESKGWYSDADRGTSRERNRLCIEDPFETDFNVARCVTRDGLYTIRGELMRASRILAARPDRAVVALAQLCEERKDEELVQASPSRGPYPPRLSALPPQTPYTVGSNPMRPTGAPQPDRLSPPQSHETPPLLRQQPSTNGIRLPVIPPDQHQLDHMAPKRSKWTSPPPPEAPENERSAFENRLGEVLALATSSMTARESEKDKDALSSTNSEVQTDDEGKSDVDLAESVISDDVRSIRSFSEEAYFHRNPPPPSHPSFSLPQSHNSQLLVKDPSSSKGVLMPVIPPVHVEVTPANSRSNKRGRPFKPSQYISEMGPPTSTTLTNESNDIKEHNHRQPSDITPPPRIDSPRRSLSGPPPRASNRFSMPVLPGMLVQSPLPAYPSRTQAMFHRNGVYYETSPSARDRLSRAVAQAQGQSQAQTQTKSSSDAVSGSSPQKGQASSSSSMMSSTIPSYQFGQYTRYNNGSPTMPVTAPRHMSQSSSPSASTQHSPLLSYNQPTQHIFHPYSYPQQQYIIDASDVDLRTSSTTPSQSHPHPHLHSKSVSSSTTTTSFNHPTQQQPVSLVQAPSPQLSYDPLERQTDNTRLHSHSHSHSTATIIAPTPPPSSNTLLPSLSRATGCSPPCLESSTINRSAGSSSGSRPPSASLSHGAFSPGKLPTNLVPVERKDEESLEISIDEAPPTARERDFRSESPLSEGSASNRSPSMISCSTSSQYAASVSPSSTSPPSPGCDEHIIEGEVQVVSLPASGADEETIGDSKVNLVQSNVGTKASPQFEPQIVVGSGEDGERDEEGALRDGVGRLNLGAEA